MLELNENELCVEVKEFLSWEHGVKPIYEDLREDAKYLMEEYPEDYTEEDIKNIKQFVENDPTKEDKIDMLRAIMDNYEYDSSHNDNGASLFDEDTIRQVVIDFVEENYDVKLNF